MSRVNTAKTAPSSTADTRAPAGHFSMTGSMIYARYCHKATLLANGKVLVTGGFIDEGQGTAASAELYDPTSGTFALTGSMTGERVYHGAILLKDGRVLVAGGHNNVDEVLPTAELYDPATGAFTATGRMSRGRAFPCLAPLADGRVLVVGGDPHPVWPDVSRASHQSVEDAELYDPANGTFSSAGQLAAGFDPRGAFRLRDGRVFLIGLAGSADPTQPLWAAEFYDPATGTFGPAEAANLPIPGIPGWGAMAQLADGRVLLAGGNVADKSSRLAFLCNPANLPLNRWSKTGSMAHGHDMHTATLLLDGRVLIAGGEETGQLCLAAELYDPATGQFSSTGSMLRGLCYSETATRLADGRVLIAGGMDPAPNQHEVAAAELYTP
jgi:hypothetical protein